MRPYFSNKLSRHFEVKSLVVCLVISVLVSSCATTKEFRLSPYYEANLIGGITMGRQYEIFYFPEPADRSAKVYLGSCFSNSGPGSETFNLSDAGSCFGVSESGKSIVYRHSSQMAAQNNRPVKRGGAYIHSVDEGDRLVYSDDLVGQMWTTPEGSDRIYLPWKSSKTPSRAGALCGQKIILTAEGTESVRGTKDAHCSYEFVYSRIPRPEDPERSVIGIQIESQGGILSQKPDAVFFVAMENDGALSQDYVFTSNFTQGDRMYLLNARPGKYAAVATFRSQMNSVGFTTYFSKELIEATRMDVRPGEAVFMGSYVVHMSIGLKEAEPIQRHYANVLALASSKGRVSRLIPDGAHYRGTLDKLKRDSDARTAFLKHARDDLAESDWGPLLSDRP
jgi:hypothetical protein